MIENHSDLDNNIKYELTNQRLRTHFNYLNILISTENRDKILISTDLNESCNFFNIKYTDNLIYHPIFLIIMLNKKKIKYWINFIYKKQNLLRAIYVIDHLIDNLK